MCCSCGSNRVAAVTAKCSDCCSVEVAGSDREGYVPCDMGIGGGDYIEFSWCLECGKMQGSFPMPQCEGERFSKEVHGGG
jgi:hypothetical protein